MNNFKCSLLLPPGLNVRWRVCPQSEVVSWGFQVHNVNWNQSYATLVYLSARKGGELLRLRALWGLLFPSTILLAQLFVSFFLFLICLTLLLCCNQDRLDLPQAFDIRQLNCAQFWLCVHFMSK